MQVALKIAFALFLGMGAVFALHVSRQTDQAEAHLESRMREDQRAVGQLFRPTVARAWRTDGRDSAMYLIEYTNQILEQEQHQTALRLRWVWLDDTSVPQHDAWLNQAGLAKLRAGEEVDITRRVARGRTQMVTYIPVQIGIPDQPAGALEVSGSLDGLPTLVDAARRSKIVTAAVLLGVSVLIAVLVGAFLVGRPVRRLVHVARRIGGGDLSARANLHQHDELGALARAMNEMGDQLQTARRRLAEETEARIRSVERLRHADRLSTVGTLASGVAHELGTPLAVISARAEMMASGEVEPGVCREYADNIIRQCKRMTAIIHQLLDFARRRKPTLSPKDPQGVINQTVEWLSPLARKHGVRIEVAQPVQPMKLNADGVQLQQVLTNLLVNAVHASARGGVVNIHADRVDASAPTGADGKYVRIVVEDHGEGMPADVVEHVFEPFFTTKDVGQGTGLGLSVSHGIVQEHGGWIDVSSRMGHGSSFAVYLPAC